MKTILYYTHSPINEKSFASGKRLCIVTGPSLLPFTCKHDSLFKISFVVIGAILYDSP